MEIKRYWTIIEQKILPADFTKAEYEQYKNKFGDIFEDRKDACYVWKRKYPNQAVPSAFCHIS